MKQRAEIIEALRQSYEFLSSEFAVNKLAVFGSVAKDMMTPDSDVDIIIDFNSPIGFRFNQLVEYLEDLLERKVDVITKDGVKNIRVKEISDNIKKDLIYV